MSTSSSFLTLPNLFPHFTDLPPATQAQAALVYSTLHVTPKMVRYDHLELQFGVVNILFGLVISWIILRTGLSARCRNYAIKIAPRFLFIQAFLTYYMISCTLFVITLPLESYSYYFVPAKFGLMNESIGGWLQRSVEGSLINITVAALMVGLLYVIMRRAPRHWPVLFASALTPIIAFGIFISPIVIDPIFNTFSPLLPASPLYASLRSLTTKAGVANATIFIVDKSKQTIGTNAYVDGLGGSARIVIWDTMIQQMPQHQVVAVVGHELGHYVEGHILFGFGLTMIALFAGLPALKVLLELLISRWGAVWKIQSLIDPASIAVVLLAFQIVWIVTLPLSNLVSRWFEHKADAYSLGMVRDRVGLAESFVSLSKDNLSVPDPPAWEEIWFGDHPTLGSRIRYALYGQPNQ